MSLYNGVNQRKIHPDSQKVAKGLHFITDQDLYLSGSFLEQDLEANGLGQLISRADTNNPVGRSGLRSLGQTGLLTLGAEVYAEQLLPASVPGIVNPEGHPLAFAEIKLRDADKGTSDDGYVGFIWPWTDRVFYQAEYDQRNFNPAELEEIQIVLASLGFGTMTKLMPTHALEEHSTICRSDKTRKLDTDRLVSTLAGLN